MDLMGAVRASEAILLRTSVRATRLNRKARLGEADLKALFFKPGSVLSVKIVKARTIMRGRGSVFSFFPPRECRRKLCQDRSENPGTPI